LEKKPTVDTKVAAIEAPQKTIVENVLKTQSLVSGIKKTQKAQTNPDAAKSEAAIAKIQETKSKLDPKKPEDAKKIASLDQQLAKHEAIVKESATTPKVGGPVKPQNNTKKFSMNALNKAAKANVVGTPKTKKIEGVTTKNSASAQKAVNSITKKLEGLTTGTPEHTKLTSQLEKQKAILAAPEKVNATNPTKVKNGDPTKKTNNNEGFSMEKLNIAAKASTVGTPKRQNELNANAALAKEASAAALAKEASVAALAKEASAAALAKEASAAALTNQEGNINNGPHRLDFEAPQKTGLSDVEAVREREKQIKKYENKKQKLQAKFDEKQRKLSSSAPEQKTVRKTRTGFFGSILNKISGIGRSTTASNDKTFKFKTNQAATKQADLDRRNRLLAETQKIDPNAALQKRTEKIEVNATRKEGEAPDAEKLPDAKKLPEEEKLPDAKKL
ncbi:MAG: hypothetical protein EBU33_07715, partial [Sphingobacteriia bacterium]|nr:hypothetical protein [Sphingobacteriia bacterium]